MPKSSSVKFRNRSHVIYKTKKLERNNQFNKLIQNRIAEAKNSFSKLSYFMLQNGLRAGYKFGIFNFKLTNKFIIKPILRKAKESLVKSIADILKPKRNRRKGKRVITQKRYSNYRLKLSQLNAATRKKNNIKGTVPQRKMSAADKKLKAKLDSIRIPKL